LREINLLRRERAFPEKGVRGYGAPYYLLPVTLVAVMLLVFCVQMALGAALNNRIREVEGRIAEHRKAAETYRRLVQVEEANRAKESRLRRLLASEAPWLDLLDLVPARTPPGVVYSAWRISGGYLVLDGTAPNPDTVVRLITALTEVNAVRGVELQRLARSAAGAGVDFSLRLTIGGEV